MELHVKLTGIALNRPQNHIGERTTDKGVQVGIFFVENSLAFLNWSRNRFYPKQILIISPLRNGRRDAQITTLTQRSRPISLIELGVPVIKSVVCLRRRTGGSLVNNLANGHGRAGTIYCSNNWCYQTCILHASKPSFHMLGRSGISLFPGRLRFCRGIGNCFEVFIDDRCLGKVGTGAKQFKGLVTS